MKFILVPFQSSALPDLLTGEIRLGPNRLHCEFRLHGDLESILWSNGNTKTEIRQSDAPTAISRSASELWRHSCFELFVGVKGDARYWEINVASDGRWQCYQFDDVRLGMKESDAFRLDTYNFELSLNEVNFQITLNHGLDTDTQIQTGISVVLESTTSELHYYALSHGESKPDFHQRESHSLQLHQDTK